MCIVHNLNAVNLNVEEPYDKIETKAHTSLHSKLGNTLFAIAVKRGDQRSRRTSRPFPIRTELAL